MTAPVLDPPGEADANESTSAAGGDTASESRWRRANPVLARELRQRMSTPRVTIVITLYLLVLGVVVVLLYRARSNVSSSFGQPGVTQIASIGQSLFEFVLFFMTLLVLFIVPGFTAASIAGERERQTLRALQVTLLSPRNIVFGKVGASVALTMLLLVASLPLLAVAYLVGGITFDEVFVSLGVVLFAAFALACMTVACSAVVKRVPGAILTAYGLVLVLVIGSFVAYGVAGEYDSSRGDDPVEVPSWLLAANPLAAVAEVSDRAPAPTDDDLAEGEFFGPFGAVSSPDSSSPLSSIRDFMHNTFLVRTTINGGPFAVPVPPDIAFDQFGNPIVIDADQGFEDRDGGQGRLSYLNEFFICFGAMALLGLLIASRRIATPARTDR